mgnify:CR=1 FL=1
MPVYVYEIIQPDGSGGARFEAEQAMGAAALTAHPRTGEPVRRVYCPPNLGGRYSDKATARRLDTGNVEKAGFTKYQRDKLTGKYHKVAGRDASAPTQIDPHRL